MSNNNHYQRIDSLDFLRGIAVLGILIINIESFAYYFPFQMMHGFKEPLDVTVRFWVYFLAQGKFYSMFTLLFGAGFYIFLERLESKGYGLKALDLYSRRLLWLFVFGVIHAYFIWSGDVLYHYAACGFFLFAFRSFSVSKLSVILMILIAILFFDAYQRTKATQQQYQDYVQAIEVEDQQRSEKQQKAIDKWHYKTREKDLSYVELDTPRMTVLESWQQNYDKVKVHKGTVFYQGILFRTLITMILGIILYKSGVFHDYKRVSHYWLLSLGLLAFALVMNYSRYQHWTYGYTQPILSVPMAWFHSLPKEILGLAYVLVLNGFYQKFLKNLSFNPINSLGRMALSNYIFQSLICGFLFYGYGLGWFNQYSRSELWMIIPCIWFLQIMISLIWLRFFKQGPLEYLWRKLTYAHTKTN